MKVIDMTTSARSIAVPLTGLGWRAVAILAATTAAVIVPQLFHLAGNATGAGAGIAQTWLPMFLPVILVGLLAGPEVGAIVGIASPVIAAAVTGLPVPAMVPFMMIQLVTCGVVAGLVSRMRKPIVWSTLIVVASAPLVLLVARGLYGLAIGSGIGPVASDWLNGITAGVPGLLLQLVVVGLTLSLIGRRQ